MSQPKWRVKETLSYRAYYYATHDVDAVSGDRKIYASMTHQYPTYYGAHPYEDTRVILYLNNHFPRLILNHRTDPVKTYGAYPTPPFMLDRIFSHLERTKNAQ